MADHLQLPQFNHHRASDDAVPVAQMLAKFFVMLEERGVTRLQQINDEMTKLRPLGVKRNRFPKHIILIAKNKVGLKNLYQLISASNLKYFKRVPIIPKSELVAHREGLIIGSACEAGELFRAIVDHKDWNELKRIASFYDYLEIQPLGNNRFMVRDGTVRDDEDLKDFNRTVVKLGEELGKPVCATGDVHFLDPEDEVYRHILLASKKFADANEPVPLYFRTTDEMLKEFDYLGKEKAYEVVVTNTRAIAEQVEDIELLPKGKLFPPRLENSEEDLNRMVWGKAARALRRRSAAADRRPAERRARQHSGQVRRRLHVGAEARAALARVRLPRRLARVGRLVARRVHGRHHRGQRPAAALPLPEVPQRRVPRGRVWLWRGHAR